MRGARLVAAALPPSRAGASPAAARCPLWLVAACAAAAAAAGGRGVGAGGEAASKRASALTSIEIVWALNAVTSLRRVREGECGRERERERGRE